MILCKPFLPQQLHGLKRSGSIVAEVFLADYHPPYERVFFSLSKHVVAYRKIGRDLDVFSTRTS
jgi:hypothetical protein